VGLLALPPLSDRLPTDLTRRYTAAQELRESAEAFQNQDFVAYIKALVSTFLKTFETTQPSFRSDAPEHVSEAAMLAYSPRTD
jgi:hypothetical protein